MWNPPNLDGQVAVVTGASKGIGRGIAEVLAACGATTYLVARTEATLEEVAGVIEGSGGNAVVARCDLRDDAAVAGLFDRIAQDEGHLEIVVNNAVAWEQLDLGTDDGDSSLPAFMYQPPWHAPRQWWDVNFDVGVRSHWLVTNLAAPLLTEGRRGVVFFTSELRPRNPGEQEMVLDLRGSVVERMAMLYSLHLRPHRVSSVFLYPGFVRTEAIQRSFDEGGSYFDGWTSDEYLAKTCSTHFPGRAAASLAADPNLIERTGSVVTAIEAAEAYGFTDTTGVVPSPL